MSQFVTFAIFLLLVFGGGMLIGGLTLPGAWYESLAKPWFNPPNWLFGPAWALLYILIAVAGFRMWMADRRGPAMKAWIAQLVFNFLWSPAFFGLQRPDLALAVVLAMQASILAFIMFAWPRDRTAALLFVPYAAWVAFATALNMAILLLN